MSTIRYVAIVDGEHYPPVTMSALEDLRARGEVACAVFAGGTEKIPVGGMSFLGDVPVRTGDDARAVLWDALVELRPDAVVDLSDEPVLDYRRRHQLASVALAAGVAYEGADFRFSPPPRPRLCTKPSIAAIATGKRTGKTAAAVAIARALKRSGASPVIVAMGRGGPPEPEVLRGDRIALEAEALVRLADEGRHAASDYVEDALLARVPTVGCRRCGGGLAGGVDFSNVAAGVALANELPGDVILLEGSGSAIPPVHADVTLLVVPAGVPGEYLSGYMGLYRLLLTDFAVVTMCDDPDGSPSRIVSSIRDSFRPQRGRGDSRGEIRVIQTVFRPRPVRPVERARVFVATTAPRTAGDAVREHLERVHGCRVVGISHSLSDRERLNEELDVMEAQADVLLCEIKAAGIDVAARRALAAGIGVVFMDNELVAVEGDGVEVMVAEAVRLARARFSPPQTA